MKWITWALICRFEHLTQYSQKHERIANLERLLRGRTDCRGGNAMTIVAKVWIEEDCITCDACADICPEVFDITDESSFIIADVREDGAFNRNETKSPLKGDLGAQLGEIIIEAAEACPVEVIQYELADSGQSEVTEEEAPVAEVEIAAAPVSASAPVVDGALAGVMEGERELVIMFGSQTGNAEGLAAVTAKKAADYGLQAKVVDMDGYDLKNLAQVKRLLLITSTWGEGEMPDNAEALWQSALSASGMNFANTHFSVCAIGDSSYDEFCKAGTDWDEKLSAFGGQRIHDIQLCDVDYEPPYLLWVNEALSRIACVDESGTFQVELVDSMKEYASGSADDVADDGDFAPGQIQQSDMDITFKIFRYDPATASTGWDEFDFSIPGHATLQDALLAIKGQIDGSLTFRTSYVTGTNPLTGIKANGRIVMADTVRVVDLCSHAMQLKLEPMPGHEVIKDLMVSYDEWQQHRIKSKPWMQSEPRIGDRLPNGMPMGTIPAAEATALHAVGAVMSYQLVQGMSDCYASDSKYRGPGLNLLEWARSLDPRVGSKQYKTIMESLQTHGGVWDEADLSSLSRHGRSGQIAADSLYDARSRLLAEFKFIGRSGRLAKNYARSVKASGNVNETTLYRSVLGPFGLASNIMNGVSLRMLLGFTRNGGPIMRGFQGMLVPPAGIGKIPNMFNARIKNHHEVVAIFNEVDTRF